MEDEVSHRWYCLVMKIGFTYSFFLLDEHWLEDGTA